MKHAWIKSSLHSSEFIRYSWYSLLFSNLAAETVLLLSGKKWVVAHRSRSWWSRTSCSRCAPAATFLGCWRRSWEWFRTGTPACRWRWCSAASCSPACAASWICRTGEARRSCWGSRRSWWSPAPRTARRIRWGRACPCPPERPPAPGHRSGWSCSSDQPGRRTSCSPFIGARPRSAAAAFGAHARTLCRRGKFMNLRELSPCRFSSGTTWLMSFILSEPASRPSLQREQTTCYLNASSPAQSWQGAHGHLFTSQLLCAKLLFI